VVPVVIRGSGGELPGRPLRVLPGLRFPPLCAGQPRRRDESRVEGTLALAALWPSPTCGMAAAAASGPGPGEKGQRPKRAATLATGLRGLFPVFSLLGRLVETRCSCRRGWASCPVSSRNAGASAADALAVPAARPASLRKGRISTRPGRPLSSSGSSPASRKPRRSLLMRRTSCG
jgi:hypothetical protein